ncbi:MAG: NAD(P)-dependent oxidoreductase [Rubrivivax sp.]|nr:NAD(P)-dependent oxidoreductase [Rubrivivax sp.]
MATSSIGFVGASGLMGHGMARHLLAHVAKHGLQSGNSLRIAASRRPERVADLLAAGASTATLAELGAHSDVVFICVTGSPDVEAVVLGSAQQPGGLLRDARPDLVIVDCSTSEPQSTALLRTRCAERGVTLVDAPLARTPVEAEAGRLNVMVGAEPDVFIRVEPLIRAFAENVFHMGGPGAGHTIKLLNNFIAQAICTATAEAFAVGRRAGVDLHRFVDLVSQGAVNCGLFQAMAKTLDGDMTGLMFELDNARKDLRYYTHLAEGLAVPSLVGTAVHQSLAVASALGHGKKFVPALVQAQEQLSGAQIVGTPNQTTGDTT